MAASGVRYRIRMTRRRGRSGPSPPGRRSMLLRGALLRRCGLAGRTVRLRQPEQEERVAERVADLEVAAAGDADHLLAVQLEGHRRRIAAGSAVPLPQQLPGL